MSLDDLKLRVLGIARHDSRLALFGANTHQWRVELPAAGQIEALEAQIDAPLPALWRRWVGELMGTRVGPFYGLAGIPDGEQAEALARPFVPGATSGESPVIDGVIPLSDHGCGYSDMLVANGPHAGEVWVDWRANGDPPAAWYPSLEAWLQAWLRRAEADWALEYLLTGLPEDTDPAFLVRVAAALEWAAEASDDPMLRAYPIPLDKVHQARARLHIEDGDLDAAAEAFDAAARCSKEADAIAAVGRCAVAEARGDHTAHLAAAEEGLTSPNLWWIHRKELLSQKVAALEGLARWRDALAARVQGCEHDPRDVHAWLTVAWAQVQMGDFADAAAWLRRLAEDDPELDQAAPLKDRMAEVSGGLLRSLDPEDATQLRAAIDDAYTEEPPA
jgi:tetratricopeptide (TPR) repeat protein